MGRSFRARVAGAAVAAGAVVALAGLTTTEQGCKEAVVDPPISPPIVIGVSLGLTKGLAPVAGPLRDTIRVAEGQINSAGGLLGRRVVFDVQDDESDESGAVIEKVANDFVAKGVVAVIGPIGSQQVVKTHGIYAKAKILQISPSATSTTLNGLQPAEDRWLYRTAPSDDFQGAAVMLLAQRTPRGLDGGAPAQVDGGPPPSCTRLAIINVDNAYGNSMADVIETNFPLRTNQPIIARKKLPVGLASSYADVIAQLIPLNPQCVALILYPDVGLRVVREFKNHPGFASLVSQGFFFIGTDGIYTDGFLKGGRQDESDPTSPNVAEGIFGTNPDTQPGTSEYNEFRAIFGSYTPLNGKDAPTFAANTFDAALLLALAIQRAGSVDDRPRLREALLEVATPPGRPYTPAQLSEALVAVARDDIDYKGASGEVDLERIGNVKSGFIVWEAYRNASNQVEYRTVAKFDLASLVSQIQ